MKESKFIELLNLYIDQQIRPADAAELEEEILKSASRRRTYQQYCRMHRACTLVFESAHPDRSLQSAALSRVDADLDENEPAGRRYRWRFYAAGLAAAACVTFVAVQVFQRPSPPATAGALAAVESAPAPSAVRDAAAIGESMRINPATTPAIFRRDLPFTVVSLGALRPAERPAGDPLRPSIEAFVFEPSAAGPSSPSTFRSRPVGEGEVQMTAFQFQR